MRVSVQWDDESKTIIRYTYQQNWTWADYDVAVEAAHQLVSATEDPSRIFDVIADFSASSLLPQYALTNFQRSLSRSNAIPFGLAVLIVKSMFFSRMVGVFAKMNHQMMLKIRVAKTIEEARDVIGGAAGTTLSDDTHHGLVEH